MLNYDLNETKGITLIRELSSVEFFFEKPLTEFSMFYKKILIPAPQSYFTKLHRYKKLLIDNDCQDIVQTMTRRGQSLKYRRILLDTLQEIYIIKIRKKFKFKKTYLMMDDSYLLSWIYDFNKLFKLTFYFRFNFHKIDKRVKKFNKKKKINYKVSYNYIPAFKRRKWFIKQLINQMKHMPQRNYSLRLFGLIRWLVRKPKTTYLYKIKRFTYESILKTQYHNTLLKSQ